MRELWSVMSDDAKHLMDGVSVFTLLGTLAQMLPNIASLLTVVWLGLRIYESETVQGWLKK